MSELMRMFHEGSPYEGHDLAAHPADLQGLGSHDPVFEEILSRLRPSRIIEVGTWKGASAVHMAKTAQKLNLSTEILCIDTWLGSWEHLLGRRPDWRNSLRVQNGYPRLYFTFLTNVITNGVTDFIVPLPSTSEIAAQLLTSKKVKADLVYIDASHDVPSVLRDLRMFWPILNDDGAIFGDDYKPGNSIATAAHQFATEVKRPVAGRPAKFIIPKRGEPADFAPSLVAAQVS